jgi:hypothetical protein
MVSIMGYLIVKARYPGAPISLIEIQGILPLPVDEYISPFSSSNQASLISVEKFSSNSLVSQGFIIQTELHAHKPTRAQHRIFHPKINQILVNLPHRQPSRFKHRSAQKHKPLDAFRPREVDEDFHWGEDAHYAWGCEEYGNYVWGVFE